MDSNKVPVYSDLQIQTVVSPTRFSQQFNMTLCKSLMRFFVFFFRFQEVKHKFSQVFGDLPTFYARAPGRVNLIGEHVDYSGYSVLPMVSDPFLFLFC
jgi:hypothetical protein